MATTTATQYYLGYVTEDGRVQDHRQLGSPSEPGGSFYAVWLCRFWPASRPGAVNDPWNLASSVGRDRGALSLHVAPLLRTDRDLDATAIRVFDVCTRVDEKGLLPPVSLDSLLPAKVRAGDGVLIQADLVDVSLFTRIDDVLTEAGRIIDRRPRQLSQLSLNVSDTVALLSEVGGAVLTSIWRGVLRPTGVDARAWDPQAAQFSLHGPSLGLHPGARAGRYLLAGAWQELDLDGARYDPNAGLCLADGLRIAANVLEFELLALKETP